MNLELLLAHPLAQALGWTLLHFIWQGAVLALVLAAVLGALRERAANARYAAATITMLLLLAAPVVTFSLIGATPATARLEESALPLTPAGEEAARATGRTATPPATATATRPLEATAGGSPAPLLRRWAERIEARIAPVLPWLVFGWFCGWLALSVRLCGGLLITRRLRRRGLKPLPAEWQNTLAWLRARMGVARAVSLGESALVRTPMVIGWLRPAILLPSSALLGLSPQQLEAVLAHELAHIRRHDYLVNLLQTVAETLLFYHPAVWWVSGRIRAEREHACDDLAVAATGSALVYARALAELESLRGGGNPHLALAAMGGGPLLKRVRRLVETPPARPRRLSSALAAAMLALAVGLAWAGARAALFDGSRQPLLAAVSAQAPAAATAADSAPGATPQRDRDQALRAEAAVNIARDELAGEDAEARSAALAALGERAGAVVVMDARTGRVLTIVNQEWALRRSWIPASTSKVVTALAATQEGVVNPAERLRFAAGEPRLNLARALAVSNSSYFEFVGNRLGFERFARYARQLGLGEPTGINLPGEIAGRLPASAAGVSAGRIGSYGETLEVTPLQLATLTAAIANGGELLAPRLPRPDEDVAAFAPQVRRQILLTPEARGYLTRGMLEAVTQGTAARARLPETTIAGKTGTTMQDGARLGLFMAYAPADAPRWVVVVATRGAEESGPAAAAIAGKIFEWLY